MQIPTAIAWTDGFKQATTGDGAISISGGVATLSAGEGTGSAYFTKYVKSAPGDVLTFSVMARRISGNDGLSGRIKVEHPVDSPGEGTAIHIESADWREYEVTRAAGLAATTTDHFNLAVGVFTASGGEIQVAEPRIKITNGRNGAARVHAYGLIKMTAGVPVLEEDYVKAHITALSYDAGTSTLTLTTPRGLTGFTGGAGAGPLMFCNIHSDNASAAHLVAKMGGYDRALGTCVVKFYDMNTGAVVDVSGIAGSIYLSLMMVL